MLCKELKFSWFHKLEEQKRRVSERRALTDEFIKDLEASLSFRLVVVCGKSFKGFLRIDFILRM